MEIFKLDTLTRENIKHILREGAHTNNILRVTDDCFERMVDALNLSLDIEPEDVNEHLETLRDDVMEDEKQEELDKSKVEDETDQLKENGKKTVTGTSSLDFSNLSNKLILGNQ